MQVKEWATVLERHTPQRLMVFFLFSLINYIWWFSFTLTTVTDIALFCFLNHIHQLCFQLYHPEWITITLFCYPHWDEGRLPLKSLSLRCDGWSSTATEWPCIQIATEWCSRHTITDGLARNMTHKIHKCHRSKLNPFVRWCLFINSGLGFLIAESFKSNIFLLNSSPSENIVKLHLHIDEREYFPIVIKWLLFFHCPESNLLQLFLQMYQTDKTKQLL